MTTKNNFIYLIFSLTALMLCMALSQQFFSSSAQRLTQSATAVILVISVWGVERGNTHFFKKALGLSFFVIFTALTGKWLDSAHLESVHLFLMLFFFIITALQIAKQVLLTGAIDGNKILGAICLYVLVALIWALLYTLCELYMPGSFNGMTDEHVWYKLFPTFIYFSFVTLTTLGFGDISPALPFPRFLVALGAVAGQFYMAVLVASLVGAHMSSRASSQNNTLPPKN